MYKLLGVLLFCFSLTVFSSGCCTQVKKAACQLHKANLAVAKTIDKATDFLKCDNCLGLSGEKLTDCLRCSTIKTVLKAQTDAIKKSADKFKKEAKCK
jgi:hypothetical protein